MRRRHKLFWGLTAGTALSAAVAIGYDAERLANPPSLPVAAPPVGAKLDNTNKPLPGVDRTQAFENRHERQAAERIIADYKGAGLAPPAYFYPFPHQFKKDGYYNEKNKNDDILVGAGKTGFLAKSLGSSPDYRFSCQSQINFDQRTMQLFRLKVAFHESSHGIAAKLNLTKDLADKVAATSGFVDKKQNEKAQDLLRVNVDERVADAAAELYMLGNIEGSARFMPVLYDWRVVHKIEDPGHNTASTIAAAYQAYARNPKPGLSLVAATKWAAKIVEGQEKQLFSEYYINMLTDKHLSSPDRMFGAPTQIGSMIMGTHAYFGAISANYAQVEKSADHICGRSPNDPAYAVADKVIEKANAGAMQKQAAAQKTKPSHFRGMRI